MLGSTAGLYSFMSWELTEAHLFRSRERGTERREDGKIVKAEENQKETDRVPQIVAAISPPNNYTDSS